MPEINNVFRKMQEYADIHHVPIIGLPGADLLANIVKENRPQRVLEIGTAIGYSTLIMATGIPPDGYITTIEIDESRVEVAKAFLGEAGYLNKVEFICQDASEVLPELVLEYDLVFIDAAKGQYLNYLKHIIKILAPNAVIIADNVLFRGMVYSDNAPPRRYKTLVRRLREYLCYVCENNMFKTKIYDIGDGLAVSYFQGENKDE